MQLFDGNLHMISCQCLVEQVAFVFQMAHYSAYLAAETVRRQSGEWLELRRQCQEKVLPTTQAASACEHVVGSLANMFIPLCLAAYACKCHSTHLIDGSANVAGKVNQTELYVVW